MGSIGFLPDFEFYMAVLEVGSGPIGLVAPRRFKILDSQPGKSNMGPVPIDVHDFRLFQKSCHGFLALYLPRFRSDRLKTEYLSFSAGTKKMRGEKLHRFVVVSPREVPSLRVSCPFKIFNFRSFLKVRSLSRSQKLEKSVH